MTQTQTSDLAIGTRVRMACVGGVWTIISFDGDNYTVTDGRHQMTVTPSVSMYLTDGTPV